jgi:endonuclease YncB( thermonuclease family)
MNQEKIWREFAALPPEAQQLVADFISFLQTRYKQARSGKKAKQAGNLADEAFIGIWRDRADMQDSNAWVRGVREREWIRVRE